MIDTALTMAPEEVRALYQPFAFDPTAAPSINNYRFHGRVSGLGARLAIHLQGGRNADPNVAPAMKTAALLEKHLEALAIVHGLAPPATSSTPHQLRPTGDLPAMLSDAGRDARYVKRLLEGGGGMSVGSNVTEALRVVRTLVGKLEATLRLNEGLPEPRAAALTRDH